MSEPFQEQPKKGFIPAQQGYIDRKMVKWDGFILSDHAELQKKSTALRNKVNTPKEKQSLEVISHCLSDAFLKQRPVAIQVNVRVNGLYEDELTGTVSGFEDSQIYIQTASDLTGVDIETIRHVSFVSMVKWFKSDC